MNIIFVKLIKYLEILFENKVLRNFSNFCNVNKEKIYIVGILIYLCSLTISGYTVLGDIIPNLYLSLLKYFGLVIVLLKILLVDIKNYSYDQFKKVVGVFFLVLLITFSSKNRTFLQYFIFIIGMKDVPFKKVVQNVMIMEMIIVLIIISLSLLGVIENRIYTRTNVTAIRYSLGFKDCKYPSIFIWSITLMYIFLRDKNATLYEFLLLYLVNLLFYALTDSKNELICALLFIFGASVIFKIDKNKVINRILFYISKYIMIALFLVFFSLSIFYNSKIPFMKKIDTAFSGRLNLTKKAFTQYGISLFGAHIKWIGLTSVYLGIATKSQMNFVDCSYLKIMFEYGIIGVTLILFGFFKVVETKQIRENNILLFTIIIIAIHSFLDPQLFVLPINIYLLLLSNLFFAGNELNIKNKQTNLNSYSIIDTNKYMSLEEIHDEELSMLKSFISFCEINDINYFICGGSLLGAIRHSGFIPWDDDIDILMPRPDYNKFLKKVRETDLLIDDNLEVHASDLNNLNDPFCKIMNLKTKMNKHYINDEYDRHLWLDIFPMDGLPESKIKTVIIYKKIKLLRRILVLLKVKDEIIKNESKTKTRAIIKPIIRFLLKPIGIKRIVKLIDRICKKYDFNTSNYVGGIAWGYGPQEKLRKEKINNLTVIFEGIKVNTFECWDEYLTNLYGDYMQLPSEEKRVAHVMKVKKLNI